MLTFLSFFVRHTCSLLQCWQDAWTETAPPDISQLKDGGEVMSLPLSVFYPRKIRAQVKLYSSSSSSSFEIARSASPSTLLSRHFARFPHPPLLPLQTLISLPSRPPAPPSHSFSLILNPALVDRQSGELHGYLAPGHLITLPIDSGLPPCPPPASPTPRTISAPQTVCSKGDIRAHGKERGKRLHLRASNSALVRAMLHTFGAQTTNSHSDN